MSVKVPRSGSRGLRFPRVLARFGNRFMLWQFGRGGARTGGGIDTLMLETVVLGYLPEGDDAWLVIAALAGAARHPAWFHNLASHPDAAIQFADGSRFHVRAETLEDDDLDAAWQRIAQDAPEFVGYRSKTDREIPVVRLRRR
jgi:deazaflavin-dependent oxidoreductase (nitroreductase family)